MNERFVAVRTVTG